MLMVAKATQTSVTARNRVGTRPRLSGGAKLRRFFASKPLSSFARLDSRGRLSPRGLRFLSIW